jgi:hypothetical protein
VSVVGPVGEALEGGLGTFCSTRCRMSSNVATPNVDTANVATANVATANVATAIVATAIVATANTTTDLPATKSVNSRRNRIYFAALSNRTL